MEMQNKCIQIFIKYHEMGIFYCLSRVIYFELKSGGLQNSIKSNSLPMPYF